MTNISPLSIYISRCALFILLFGFYIAVFIAIFILPFLYCYFILLQFSYCYFYIAIFIPLLLYCHFYIAIFILPFVYCHFCIAVFALLPQSIDCAYILSGQKFDKPIAYLQLLRASSTFVEMFAKSCCLRRVPRGNDSETRETRLIGPYCARKRIVGATRRVKGSHRGWREGDIATIYSIRWRCRLVVPCYFVLGECEDVYRLAEALDYHI